MKVFYSSLLVYFGLVFSACNTNGKTESGELGDNSKQEELIPELPDTAFESVKNIDYIIQNEDSLEHTLKDFKDIYDDTPNVMTFRKNLKRNADFKGKVMGTPMKINIDWVFNTDEDFRPTSLGTWGGGTGWSGQPLYVNWPDKDFNDFKNKAKNLTEDFSNQEIIFGSLCSKVYFLNFNNGKISRQPIDVKNVLKGTMSLDTEMKNLYVGQGVSREQPFGSICVDLFTQEYNFLIGSTAGAWRNWNGFDSSAIIAGDYLFWAAENGTVYKFERQRGNAKLISALKYKVKGAAPGIESSITVYRNYGFFSDNNGNIICINLNNMKPVWHYDNHDDSDGTMICNEENGVPYLYSGCEVDKQGHNADCHLIKINALNGQLVWQNDIPCQRLSLGQKTLDGGMYASPLFGKGDCEGMIFYNITRNNAAKNQGELYAINTKDGSEVYHVGYDSWAWSSPVAFYNENNQTFIFTGDARGNVYLIKGKTGEIIYKQKVANNFESSPVVVGNSAIVGSRGNGIYKFSIQ